VKVLLRDHFGCDCVAGAAVVENGVVPAVAG